MAPAFHRSGPRGVCRGDGVRRPPRGRVLDRRSDGGHGRADEPAGSGRGRAHVVRRRPQRRRGPRRGRSGVGLCAVVPPEHQSSRPTAPAAAHPCPRNFKAGKRRLSTVIARIVAERRQNPGTDILSRLLSARDSEGDRAALSPEHLHDEAVTLLIAGHETTGATLAWAWHLMAQHPEIGDRLAAEVHAVVGEAPPESQDLPKLAYARWIFAEALRLYPTAIALPRQAQKSVVLGGYTAPKGTLLMVATWCAHRDPRWWERPLEFLPERWDPANLVRPTKVCVLPVRGWRSHVHRRGVRLDRRHIGAGHAGPALAGAGSARPRGATRGAVHGPSSRWASNGGGGAVRGGRGITAHRPRRARSSLG